MRFGLLLWKVAFELASEILEPLYRSVVRVFCSQVVILSSPMMWLERPSCAALQPCILPFCTHLLSYRAFKSRQQFIVETMTHKVNAKVQGERCSGSL
jgi:hypothetical protein